MSPVDALVAAKVAILIAAGLGASLCLRGSAASRHAFLIATFILVLTLPFAAALLPSWPVLTAPWAASAPDAAGAPATNGLPRTIAFVWLVGTLIILIREIFGQLQLERMIRRAAPVREGGWRASLDALRETQPRRTVRVLESPEVSGPCTWGVLRPVLLLPSAGSDWSERQRRDALVHELAHINRFDYVSTLIGWFACALHWYNPLIWLAAAEARRLQEEACDACVLGAGGRASDYALFLVSLSARPAIGALAIARSPVRRRVEAMFARAPGQRRPAALFSLTGVLVAGALALACAAPRAQTAQPSGAPGAPARVQSAARGDAASMPPTDVQQPSSKDSLIEAAPATAMATKMSPVPPIPPVPPTPPVPPVPPVPPIPPA